MPCFKKHQFDLIFCIQNGISAFHIDKRLLIESTLHLLRPGGTALFSSYAHQIWEQRLAWFRLQADEGLIGPIDEKATRNGIIVCRDGFEAHTVGSDEFENLTRNLNAETELSIIDDSSLFCSIRMP
jgi:2-polyprenyl-6-hydroxyphenyl methylase/3-demethylubiquinone-9 3-methyltransferase